MTRHPTPGLGVPTGEMNAKIVLTRNSPVRSVLVNETTGQVLYRIDTPHRFVGRVTRVFRRNPATPSVPNLMPQPPLDGDEPHEDHVSEELELVAVGRTHNSGEMGGNEEGDDVGGAGEETLGEESPLVENEIARIYWKWFSSPRIIFEGKIRTRAEYMPLKSRLRRTYVFNHEGVSYRWSPGPMGRPKLVVDSSEAFIAQFHPNVFSKEKAYLEVAPAGMAMLDHIVVTFIPVEVQRRK